MCHTGTTGPAAGGPELADIAPVWGNMRHVGPSIEDGHFVAAGVYAAGTLVDGLTLGIDSLLEAPAKIATRVIEDGFAAKEAGIVADGLRGRASEARVLADIGLAKNTMAVSTAEGRSIPDALTKSLSVEVKDAAAVYLSRQLRIQTEAARAAGRESVLITGEKTCVSGPCSRAFDTIIRRPDLGPK